MPDQTSVTCKKCNRIVWTTDVDANGLCCFCAPVKTDPKTAPTSAPHATPATVIGPH